MGAEVETWRCTRCQRTTTQKPAQQGVTPLFGLGSCPNLDCDSRKLKRRITTFMLVTPSAASPSNSDTSSTLPDE